MEPLKILLVEDHQDTIEAMARLLSSAGYNVTPARGYRAALEQATARRFDLLLSDIHLPDGDGCDLIQEILTIYPIQGIAVSGYGMQKDVDRCLKAGYHMHLLKPTTIQRIRDAITRICHSPLRVPEQPSASPRFSPP